MSQTKTYYFWADLIRVTSIFLVVLLHVSAVLLYQWGNVPKDFWWSANIYDSLARVSVPLFVMLSGALLLSKQESYVSFFRKRLQRVIVPWIFWTGVYVFWQITFHQLLLHNFAEFKSLVIETFFGGFWFLVMLVGVYLLTPFWQIFVQHAHKMDFIYFFSWWILIASILPFLGQFFHFQIFSLPLSLQYSGYFVLGYWLTQNKLPFTQKKLFLIGSCMVIFIIFGTYYLSLKQQHFNELFYDFMTPLQVICATVFFTFLSNIQVKQIFQFLHLSNSRSQHKLEALMLSLSEATFGIYLVHMILLEVVERGWGVIRLTPTSFHPIFAIPVLTILVYLLSFLIIHYLKRVPLFRFLT